MSGGTPDIGFTLGIDGEKEYKSAITGINKDLAVLSSEGKKLTAQYRDNASSLEALTKKSDLYNKQIESQRKKIDTMRAALDNASATFGENSTKAQEWQIKLNRAEAELADMERGLKQTTAQLKNMGAASQVSAEDLQAAESKLSDFGGKLQSGAKAAAAAVTALIGGLTGLGAAFISTANAGAEYADNILTISTNTGLSTDYLEAYSYAAELVDVDMKTMTNSMAKNIKTMTSAAAGSEAAATAYEKLGVKVADGSGNLRDSQSVYWEVIDALGAIDDETERDSISMQIFGKSAQDLNSLISVGSKGMAEYAAEAKAAGAVLGSDALEALGSYDDTVQRVTSSTEALKNQIAARFAPVADKWGKQLLDLGKKQMPTIERAADKLAKRLDRIDIEDIGDGIDRAGKFLKAAAPLASAFVGAFAGYKLITSSAKAIDTIKTSMSALNTVMMANPAALYAATAGAIVAVAAAVYGLSKAADDSKDIINGVFAEMDGIRISALAEAYSDAAEEATRYARNVTELGEQLESSNDAFDRASDTVSFYMSKVAAAGGQISEDDAPKIAQAFRDMCDEARNSLEATTQIIYNSLVDPLIDANAAAKGEMNEYIGTVFGLEAQVKNEIAQIEEETAPLWDKVTSGTATEADWQRIEELTSRLQALNGKVSEASTSWQMFSSDIAGNKISLESIDDVNDAIDTLKDRSKAALDELNTAETTAVGAIQDYINKLPALDMTDEERANALAKLEEMQAAIRQSYEDQRSEITAETAAIYQQIYDSIASAQEQAVAEAAPNFWDIFWATTDGAITTTPESNMAARIRSGFEPMFIALEEAAQENGTAISTTFTEEITAGIESGTPEAEGAAADMAAGIEAAARSNSSSFFSIGENDARGIAAGIRSATSVAVAAATSMAEKVNAAVRAAQQIASPSKVMRKLGQYTGEGYALGIEDMEGRVARTARQLAAVTQQSTAYSTVNNNRTANISVNNVFNGAEKADALTLVAQLNRLLGDLL